MNGRSINRSHDASLVSPGAGVARSVNVEAGHALPRGASAGDGQPASPAGAPARGVRGLPHEPADADDLISLAVWSLG